MIREIAEKYNVKLHDVQKGDKYCEANSEESYINSSYCAGHVNSKCGASGRENNAEIWLGIYDDEELRLISFFHELGHVTNVVDYGDKIPLKHTDEKAAWDKGYEIAQEYKVKFSRKSKGWATRQLNSYKGWEEREVRDWEEVKKEYDLV